MMILQTLLQKQYGLHLLDMQKSKVGAGSDTWFLHCHEGKFVLKFPAESAINHPELEPDLCAFLRENGIPACDFLKNTSGSFVSQTDEGKPFTLQRLLPGHTPEWNTATPELLLESAQMLGRIHHVLRSAIIMDSMIPPMPKIEKSICSKHSLPLGC